jgi:tetratricopeptide (TPR) repeat protein
MTDQTEQLIQDGIRFYNQQDWERAQNAFEAVLSLDPDNREGNAFLGSLFIILDKPDEALICFGKVGHFEPPRDYASGEWANVLNDWGRMLINLEKYEEAIEKLKLAASLDPGNKYPFVNWGRALEKQGRYAEAAKQYEASVHADDGYAYAWNNWGRMLIELKEYEEAISKFQKALHLDPSNAHVYYFNWGLALENQESNPNRYLDAAGQYEAAVHADDAYASGWNAWGRMLVELKRYDEAIGKFRRAIEIDPKYRYAHYNLGRALEGQENNPNRYEEAAKQYELALKIDENYASAWNSWGRMLLELKRYEEAVEKFRKAIDFDPDNRHIYHRNWGIALEGQQMNPNRYEEAARQYEAAVNAKEDYSSAWVDWGRMLTELRQYDEALVKFGKAVEVDPHSVYAYTYLGWLYQLKREVGKALRCYEKTLELDDRDANNHTNLGLALIDVRRYKEAEESFKKAIELDPGLTSGHHNLAFLYERLGRYEAARKKWRDTLDAYLKIEEGKRTASDWSFVGQIQAAVFQNFAEGKKLIKAGLEHFPESVDLLVPLVEINNELKDKYSYETPGDLEAIGSAHWEAWDAYQKLKSILEKRMEKGESASDLALLGRQQKAMGENAEAEKSLDAAIKLDPSMADALNNRAVIKAGREDFKGAIQDFEAAVRIEPHDFGYVSNLAEAYRKAKRFDEAEKTYQRILGITPSHMDSLIGLGETYAAMGDAAKEGSHSADAEMMYQQAIEYFSKAIEYEEKAERRGKDEPYDASKRLKPRELNAVYYSRGYARVSLYDAQSRKSDRLLWQAQNDFRKVIKYEADENFHKAKRALSKVLERLNPVTGRNIEQRTGPILISFLAFVLFVVGLFAFFKGRPEIASPGFALSEQTLAVLEAANLPPETVQALEGLVGNEFSTQEGLLAAVKLIMGGEAFKSYEQVLLAQPLQAPPELQWKPIEIGYFTLMAFGSLIFMVAGLYLQQISKFKFGSIEIEKSSVSQISSSAALGIRK